MSTSIKCPHCRTELCDEEIASKECWFCGNAGIEPIQPNQNVSEYDPEIDDETQD